MPTLKPCPFCGNRAVISRVPGQGLSLVCTGCAAIAMTARGGDKNALEALWNRRDVRHNFSRQSKVRPCPFCASHSLSPMQGDHSVMQCQNCGVMVAFAQSDSLPTTVELWNRRAGG